MTANCKNAKLCCFCKYFYDPTNETITPRPGKDFYEINNTISKKCLVTGLMKKACNCCAKFESKMKK